MAEGTARTTFVIGILLWFPGVTYPAALDRLHKLHYSTLMTVLVVIGISLVQLLLLEIPMLAFKVAPRRTPAAIEHAKAWFPRHGRELATGGLADRDRGAFGDRWRDGRAHLLHRDGQPRPWDVTAHLLLPVELDAA